MIRSLKDGTMATVVENLTPGDILREEFLEPIGISQAELARATGLSPACVSEVVNGKRAISAEVDLRLGRYFGLSEGYWLRLQVAHDLMQARRRIAGELRRIRPRAA
jgi:addiction module HigA family antidote